MKGPSGRLKYEVSRVWECPGCGCRLRTGGNVVFLPCPKCADSADGRPKTWMKLVEQLPPPHEPPA